MIISIYFFFSNKSKFKLKLCINVLIVLVDTIDLCFIINSDNPNLLIYISLFFSNFILLFLDTLFLIAP
ncbi:ORF MSV025 hypothetical protein [Melanoplus sanguinipes entomopoxvirus]|uniref:Uncharacterized protein n=1 Tax=Melanoplus sanguinipes entomopoxvirus TaxID=83191 RepID=Q9YW66_MSEPV|nr:ORF MSV025 hypothetical protein [Melanoplus sanguinipes entomopoxvirus]AAC97614.1 ORF MSV025 hypothetical protein [Melanoplus sanguinipes entomopoxvirus 'O']